MEVEIMKPYYKNDLTTIYNGDCLEVMDYLIEQGVKVDAIITDPPYGTTACSWDSIIPFDKMWDRINKLSKEKTPILLFGSEPFNSKLRLSNIKMYKHDWIWRKEQGANFMLMKYQPQKIHEIISVFCNGTNNYYPIMTAGKPFKTGRGVAGEHLKNVKKVVTINDGTRFPLSIITVNTEKTKSYHPTQKPVALMHYLIETYTKKGDLILDFTSGSFTTCVAAEQLNRRSIGIELEKKYCDVGVKRLSQLQMRLDI
jgi:site-specific DNA-methyltransferase (adenine-specific)